MHNPYLDCSVKWVGKQVDVIQHFGDILSEKSGKSPIACRGLIRFCLKDELGTAENPSFEDTLKAFKNNLVDRLENVGIDHANSIVKALIRELKHIQSVFNMGNE